MKPPLTLTQSSGTAQLQLYKFSAPKAMLPSTAAAAPAAAPAACPSSANSVTTTAPFVNRIFENVKLGQASKEIGYILQRLEVGTMLNRVYRKASGKLERIYFRIRLDTRQLIWSSEANAPPNGYLDLRDIKEVRVGPTQKWLDSLLHEISNGKNGNGSSSSNGSHVAGALGSNGSIRKWENYERSQCFVIYYGNRFKLNTLTCAASSPNECEMWVRGLRFLAGDCTRVPYEQQMDIWLCKEFCFIPDPTALINDEIKLKDLKAFLQRNSYKTNSQKLKKLFAEVDFDQSGSLSWKKFRHSFYERILFDERIVADHFSAYLKSVSPNGTASAEVRITYPELHRFLAAEQHEAISPHYVNEKTIEEYLETVNDCQQQKQQKQQQQQQQQQQVALASKAQLSLHLLLKTFFYEHSPRMNASEPYLVPQEFLSFLFSKANELWNAKEHMQMGQNMDQPLTHYWIASSHNTYLTGDQVKSESSVDCYARALRMGCRCIEIDCWDGPDNQPVIYHGRTLTSKIRFLDVIKTINEHAFITSKCPIILSVENHCSLPQQRYMAQKFKDIFADKLVTAPLEKAGKEMPSPAALQEKIILKHKKLPEGLAGQTEPRTTEPDNINDLDLISSTKNGVLLLETRPREWKPYYFVLTTQNILYFFADRNGSSAQNNADISATGSTTVDDEDEEQPLLTGNNSMSEFLARDVSEAISNSLVTQAPSLADLSNSINSDELHYDEPWFHGSMNPNDGSGRKGREEAERRIFACPNKTNGSFLVRDSDTYVGDYTLSFWIDNKVHHARIRQKRQTNGRNKFFLIESIMFDTLYYLITHYQSHPVRAGPYSVCLSDPVPQTISYKGKNWYCGSMNREQADDLLKRVQFDGAFLVRKSDKDGTYLISFRAQARIIHCRLRKEGRLYLVYSCGKKFENLNDLIAYYQTHPLYHGVTLNLPINRSVVDRIGTGQLYDTESAYLYPSINLNTATCSAPGSFSVKAMYDYTGKRFDELSFCKHAIITNVQKHESGWWKGDYGGKRQQWFPANYVQPVLLAQIPESSSSTSNGSASVQVEEFPQKGCVSMPGANVTIVNSTCTLPSASLSTHPPIGEHSIFIQSSSKNTPTTNSLKITCANLEDLQDWAVKLQGSCSSATEVPTSTSKTKSKSSEIEKNFKIAQELSNLIIYCKAVTFTTDRVGNFTEMSSFPETKVDKWLNANACSFLLTYNAHQFTRVYPKGSRIDSSNYNPVPMWNVGIQMAAINYQTADRSMQLNQAKFALQNGGCGYVLKPTFMFDKSFNPYLVNSISELVDKWTVTVKIIAARHLTKKTKNNEVKRGVISPFVEIEIVGAEYDTVKQKTTTVTDNGLNPYWNETFTFEVNCPDLAFIRFVVNDEDLFGDSQFVGQASYPLTTIREGFRNIRLTNDSSEELEMASVLMQVTIKKPTTPPTTDL